MPSVAAADPRLATSLPAGFVLGTAGHIDHGKSTLVHALTGIDPDRLEEEKRRGMTIDLGFAYLDLPSGRRVGIVDVPGHQRFIKNMLAGAQGFDAAMLVIAADEGVMPQTREHLDILDLLGIPSGLVALTKADLVDEEWLALMTKEVRQRLVGTTLAGAPILACSALTRSGLPELVTALDVLLTKASPRPDLGRPRLPVDRSFAIQGFGAVVTGTLTGGSLEVGEEVEILPAGQRARIRGLQQHNRKVEQASPGNRTAVNLAGVTHNDIQRGDVIARPGTLRVSRRLDIHVRALGDSPFPLRHRARVVAYLGTAEISGQAILLDRETIEPGEGGWVQLYLDTPAPVLPGDRLVLRLPAPPTTLAGGTVVDAAPQRHRRRDPAVLASLNRRVQGDAAERLLEELAKHPQGAGSQQLAGALGVAQADVRTSLPELVERQTAVEAGDLILTRRHWEAWLERLRLALTAFHAAHPLRAGMPKEELRTRTGIPVGLLTAALAHLVGTGQVIEDAREVHLSTHRPALAPPDQEASLRLVQELETAGFAPPLVPELSRRYALTPALLQHLIDRGLVVRVSDELLFGRKAYDRAVEAITHFLRQEKQLTVAQARDLLGSSRKYVLPLLEHLDAQKITRRAGDLRSLR
jgi:selenocysteine-specific elongation factor